MAKLRIVFQFDDGSNCHKKIVHELALLVVRGRFGDTVALMSADCTGGRVDTSGHFFIVSNHIFLRCCFSLEFWAVFGISKKSLL